MHGAPNRLCCLAKPFSPQATEVRINPVEFNPDFVARMIPKVEWAALVQAADTLNLAEVPKEPTEGYEHDETFLRKMHHVLLEGCYAQLKRPPQGNPPARDLTRP